MRLLALDIGGANIKAAGGVGSDDGAVRDVRARSVPFALWQEPGLLARSPGACAIQLPLLSELRHGHPDAEPLERPHGDHLVVPIVIDGDRLVDIRNSVDQCRRRGAVLEGKSHQRARDLAVPGGANAILVLRQAHRQ